MQCGRWIYDDTKGGKETCCNGLDKNEGLNKVRQ